MKKALKCITLLALTVVLFLNSLGVLVYADSDETWKLKSYDEWLASNTDTVVGSEKLFYDAEKYTLNEGEDFNFKLVAKARGLYTVKIGYCAIEGKSLFASPIELALSVNGKVPYREAASIPVSRVYESVDKELEQDASGNDLQPKQKEVTPELEYIFSDSSGYHSEGLYILLEAGENDISISSLRNSICINYVEFSPSSSVISYREYRKKYDNMPQKNASSQPIIIEAEKIYRKSDCTISLSGDRSSASVTPNSADKMLLNTVGSNFSKVGQWISWKFDINESGYYNISIYAKQSINSGAISTRKFLIDGEVPFKEAENIIFPYSQDYKNYVLSANGEELLFYFEKGSHELTTQAVLGDMSDYIKRISDILTVLNDGYLEILFYTGSNPDIYRDYGFNRLIPHVLADFLNASTELAEISNGIKSLSKGRGSNTATLDKLADILKRMGSDTDEVAANFGQLKDALSALGTWINDYSAQPLQIDSLAVIPQNSDLQVKKTSFLKDLLFKFKIFICSFASNYSEKNAQTKTVNVWIATGRDQSKIITRLANDSLSDVGIEAKISLVAADSLLPNVLAGSDIDVFLGAAATDPINYAIRDAVIDLSQFDDFEEISKRFHNEAFVPFTYKNAVYALPESFDFPLMFYRKDIFAELGIELPKTWDDFYETVAILQKNNLSVGVTWGDMFNLMLYQSGGSYYNSENTKSALDEFVSLDSFAKMLKFYTDYNLPVEFSFANRFRSGDMPLGIVSYTMYNQLYLFAPEINGLWEFAAVPGTDTGNGVINNTVLGGGSGAVILRTTKNKKNAWEFLKWWTSTDTQVNFGIEMEKIMGASARQSSANLEVVRGFPWSSKEFEVISSQWNKLKAIPQIPGSYYVGRSLDFAFNSVYSSDQEPSSALIKNVDELNEEIERKTKEFERN